MSAANKASALGRACNEAYASAIVDWRAKHANHVSLTELLAHAVTSVTVEATEFPGGRLTVITTVRARRQYDDETHVFRFRMHGDSYRLIGSSV